MRKALFRRRYCGGAEQEESDVPLSEAQGVHKRAHLLDEAPACGQQEPSITRRNRGEQAQFPLRAPLAFPPCSAHLGCVTPAVTLRIFPTHGQRSAERDLGQARAAPTTRRTN
jgi:hypothetical protein